MAIFLHFSPTSSHLYALQIENCDSNSRLVADEDDNGKLRLERVKRVSVDLTDSNKIYTLQLINNDKKTCHI